MKSRTETIQPIFDILELLPYLLFFDILILIFFSTALSLTIYLWKNAIDRTHKQEDEKDEAFRYRKDIAERTVMAAVNVGLTSASVLLAGAFALIVLAKGADRLVSTAATTQIIWGACWLIVSMIVGVWNTGVIAPAAALRDVSRIPAVNVRQTIQLWSIIIGGISILSALFVM